MKAFLRWLTKYDPEKDFDPERLNLAIQAERRRELEGDLGYRNKVKRRMLLGLTSKELPPLFTPVSKKPALVAVFPQQREEKAEEC